MSTTTNCTWLCSLLPLPDFILLTFWFAYLVPRTILLQHPLELYCSRLSDDVGKSFDTLLSIADDWDALQHIHSIVSTTTNCTWLCSLLPLPDFILLTLWFAYLVPRTILLQHPLELYCSRLSDDVGKSFDALQHNTSALSSFTILFIITLVTCMDTLLSRVG